MSVKEAVAGKPPSCPSKRVPAQSQEREGFCGCGNWEEYFGLSILSGFLPFVIPFFVYGFVNNVSNVWFGVWGVNIVGVEVVWGARGWRGNLSAFFG